MNTLPDFLSREEAAEYLRISLPTLNRLIRRGEVEAVKVGGYTRILVVSIRSMMERRIESPADVKREQSEL